MMEMVVSVSWSAFPTSLISELSRTSRALGGGRGVSPVTWWEPEAFGGVVQFPVIVRVEV